MFFLLPIRVEAGRIKPPIACMLIALACAVGFAWTRGFPGSENELALIPANGVLQLGWFTSLFLHFDWGHLLGNLLFLYLVGPLLEDAWGAWRFSALYFSGGLLANAAQVGLDWNEKISIGGASGAIAAIMGAFVVRFATRSIQVAYLVVLFRLWVGKFDMPAIVLGPLWLLIQLYGLVMDPDGPIATGAHVGGFVVGAGVALLLKARGAEKVLVTTDEVDRARAEREQLLSTGTSALEKGDFAAARADLEKLQALEPAHDTVELLLGELDIRTKRGTARWEAAIRRRFDRDDLAAWVRRVWSSSWGPDAIAPALALELALKLTAAPRLDVAVVPLLHHAAESEGPAAAGAELELAELANDWRISAELGKRALRSLMGRRDAPAAIAARAKELSRGGLPRDARDVVNAELRALRGGALELATATQVRTVALERIAAVHRASVTVGRRQLLLVELVIRRDAPGEAPFALRLTGDDAAVPALFPAKTPDEAWQAFVNNLVKASGAPLVPQSWRA